MVESEDGSKAVMVQACHPTQSCGRSSVRRMTFDFSSKTAVVTGASRGIGEAIVRQLDAGGARVALVSRSQDKLDAIAAELFVA